MKFDMVIMNDKIVHIGIGKDTLIEVPKATVYITDEAKIHYSKMGNILAKAELLKSKFLI